MRLDLIQQLEVDFLFLCRSLASLHTLHAHYTTDEKFSIFTARCHTECGYATAI